MTPPATRTKSIGEAERSLRSLLERQLEPARLTFPQWTTLVAIASSGTLTTQEVIDRQLAGHVVDNSQAAHEAIATLEFRRLISDASAGETAVEPGDTSATWTLTAAGERLFRPLRASIGEVVAELTDGLSDQALHVTSQTLAALTARANDRLAR